MGRANDKRPDFSPVRECIFYRATRRVPHPSAAPNPLMLYLSGAEVRRLISSGRNEDKARETKRVAALERRNFSHRAPRQLPRRFPRKRPEIKLANNTEALFTITYAGRQSGTLVPFSPAARDSSFPGFLSFLSREIVHVGWDR